MAKSSRSSREDARRARVEELRRAQQAQERRRTLIVVGILGVVIVAVIVAVTFALVQRAGSSDDQIIPAAVVGSRTAQQPPAKVPNTTGVKGVLAWDTKGYPAAGTPGPDTLENGHVEGPVTYAVVPPVGGPHSATWMNAGVYTSPIPPERAVHNLEHGAVWITYDPDLPAAQVSALTDFVKKQSMIPEGKTASGEDQANRFVDLSPWNSNNLPSPIVISSWGYQLRVQSPTDPRLQQFVDTFRNNETYSPEFGSPVDGIPVETGGRAASNGSAKPNPPGVGTSQ